MLMEKIGPNVRVHFEEFKWIGFFGTRLNNSHTHRLAAGESLRRRLSEGFRRLFRILTILSSPTVTAVT